MTLTELIKTKPRAKFLVDDGMISIRDQAKILVDNIGTDEEWACAGFERPKEGGLAEVKLLAHPDDARQIAHILNLLPEMVGALRDAAVSLKCLPDPDDTHRVAIQHAEAVLTTFVSVYEGNLQ